MDKILDLCDDYIFSPYVYPDWWSVDNVWRQALSLMIVATLGAIITYLIPASFGYFFLFDKRLMAHPHFLKNQVSREMHCALTNIPIMALMTVPLFLMQVRGYSKLYDVGNNPQGWPSIVLDVILFILFTDTLIYWCHRGLHSKLLYGPLHKMHHLWKIPTPFASHAFHPVDGVVQGLPYHLYIFLFPLSKFTFLALFLFVNLWTVSIHDGNCKVPTGFKWLINGSAHHVDHHTGYKYNYGQFLTLWDRLAGSYRTPSDYIGKGPLAQVIQKQTKTKSK